MPDFGDDRVMGATQQDLERWLRDFTGQQNLSFAAGRLDFADGGLNMTVLIEPQPPRRLGLIEFRDIRVQFEYPRPQSELARAWIKKFDHYTQRGGG